jgi:hypothetical protein
MKICAEVKKKIGSGRAGGEEDGFPLVRSRTQGLCCADEHGRAGSGGTDSGETEPNGQGFAAGAGNAASGAFLSELLGGIEGEPVQTELSGVRFLSELLGLLLSVKSFASRGVPRRSTIYNGIDFLTHNLGDSDGTQGKCSVEGWIEGW